MVVCNFAIATLKKEINKLFCRKKNSSPKLSTSNNNIMMYTLDSADIGNPSEFKHIMHIGWDPDYGFDINCDDSQLNTFLQKAGVSEEQMQDRSTREFIYNFINDHGGREAVQETVRELRKPAPAPPSPVAGPPVPPRSSRNVRSLEINYIEQKAFPSLKLPTNDDSMTYHKTSDPAEQKVKQNKTITKADIGNPFEFRHIVHVGWDHDNGFHINCDDSQLNTFFQKAGISVKQLQDRNTREFMHNFISDHGGQEAIQETAEVRKAPAAPPSPRTHPSTKLPNNNDSMTYCETSDPAKRKRNITKADIGNPSEFRHVTHVGWDCNNGFDINSDDPQLNTFFQKAGILGEHLQDRKTREFIYNYINIEEMVKERKKPASPSLVTRPPVKIKQD